MPSGADERKSDVSTVFRGKVPPENCGHFERGAVISIEETIKQRAISDLAEQERTTMRVSAQAILAILATQGMVDMLEPEHITLPDALKEINSVLRRIYDYHIIN